jgi:hypothetical protein
MKYIKPHADYAFPAGCTLSVQLRSAVQDLRAVRPTEADQRRNPDVDVMQVWREDIEHTIRCKDLSAEQAQEFRSACVARVATADAP